MLIREMSVTVASAKKVTRVLKGWESPDSCAPWVILRVLAKRPNVEAALTLGDSQMRARLSAAATAAAVHDLVSASAQAQSPVFWRSCLPRGGVNFGTDTEKAKSVLILGSGNDDDVGA
jgi:hypothetical protein